MRSVLSSSMFVVVLLGAISAGQAQPRPRHSTNERARSSVTSAAHFSAARTHDVASTASRWTRVTTRVRSLFWRAPRRQERAEQQLQEVRKELYENAQETATLTESARPSLRQRWTLRRLQNRRHYLETRGRFLARAVGYHGPLLGEAEAVALADEVPARNAVAPFSRSAAEEELARLEERVRDVARDLDALNAHDPMVLSEQEWRSREQKRIELDVLLERSEELRTNLGRRSDDHQGTER